MTAHNGKVIRYCKVKPHGYRFNASIQVALLFFHKVQ